MAAEILTQTESFAELATLYSEKAVADAQNRLQVVLEFKSLKPKTIQQNGYRVASPAAEKLTQKAGVGIGTVWRWYRLYRLSGGPPPVIGGGETDLWFRSASKTSPALVLLSGFSSLVREADP